MAAMCGCTHRPLRFTTGLAAVKTSGHARPDASGRRRSLVPVAGAILALALVAAVGWGLRDDQEVA